MEAKWVNTDMTGKLLLSYVINSVIKSKQLHSSGWYQLVDRHTKQPPLNIIYAHIIYSDPEPINK